MVKRGQSKGFTIVELLVVIIVVAILATLIALSYGNAQTQARDTQIRDAADKFADAIKVMQARMDTFPSGGINSNVAVDSSKGCSNGSGGFQAAGYYAAPGCTIGDAAVALGYLPPTFFTNLPVNSTYGSQTAYGKYIFMVYACGTPAKNYLFYTLERRTTDEETNYSNVWSTCAAADKATLTSSNMQAAKDLTAL